MAKINLELDWQNDPYVWCYQEGVWEPEFYREMIESLPPFDKYRQYNNIYPNRFLYPARDGIWGEVEKQFIDLFGEKIRVQLCRDKPGYSIGPHTDGQKERMTLLFYLAKDDSHPGVGTSVYVPVKHDFICDGKTHHEFADFRKLWTARYVPNSMFGFVRSDNSFHGVEPSPIVRDLIQVSVWR